ncbi:MAG: GDYXXLXY domain-containing protein [Desulfovibrio sp.]|uniref:GDYXXLXY domain-containing protein n=1 Tax=Desulfovibrio sp. TaxID=885 RepID=UPI00135EA6EE|nr:GDYXXLXY domain-containing protein [Desulfovibrio sp.]MTJ92233.1 GDYXXLXY domain-containing protein [Desulfovibrio sp.]
MRRLYILVVLVLFLGGYALAAQRMEAVRAECKTILLALAPVDPRAPLMGDYMALRYVVNNDIRKALAAQKNAQRNAQENAAKATPKSAQKDGQKDGQKNEQKAEPSEKVTTAREQKRNAEGFAVLRITNAPVPQAATFVRLDDGSPLQADEFLLGYRLRGYEVTSAAPAFYFQEGTAHQYAGAKFGVFKLAADGKTLLVGLQ